MAESDTTIVNTNTPNGAVDQETVINLDDSLSADEKIAKVLDLNKRLFERAKTAEGFEKKPDGSWVKAQKPAAPQPEPLQTPKKEPDVELHKTVAELALAEKKRQFGYANGLSPEETDAVFRINPSPTKETLEDPFVQGGLNNLRAKKRVDNNTPSSNSRSARPPLTIKPNATTAEKQQAHDEWVKNWEPKR